MISTGFPGDSDPRDEEFEYECDVCHDMFVQDLFNEWFCPTCAKNEQKEIERSKKK
jgi:hypothetical protein